MLSQIEEFNPNVVIIDPVSNLINVGIESDVKSMLTRMIDYLKTKQITTVFTSLKTINRRSESDSQISSWIDTWIFLEARELENNVKTTIRVIKSRGMAHDKRIRDFQLTDKGIKIKHGD
jgi:circadian clock protein KaiC